MTVLVSKDRMSGCFSANVVPKKGVGGGWIVKQADRELKKYGHHGRITLRSDGEPAIKDLLNRIAGARAQETVIETTPAGDSKSNGRVERAVQSIEKQARVLTLATER